MRKMRKAVITVACAGLLVVGSVAATFAYLTSNAGVTNTFTVGNVEITLDELDVDNDTYKDDNVTTDSGAIRDTANAYKLIPGESYVKDPIVHVDANSESCWVFVKVENGISAFEAKADGNDTIDEQIVNVNGWIVLDAINEPGVYYKKYEAGENADRELEVFSSFAIAANANAIEGWADIDADNNVNVTAYAIQLDGFNDANNPDAVNAAAAWDEVKPSE